MATSAVRAAFLDRDGVLNRRPSAHEYVVDAAALEILAGAPEAVADLSRAGWLAIVVSNQRGVARGLVTLPTLAAIDARLREAVAAAGGEIADFFYCPHGLDDDCACRKPRPGLLLAAAAAHGIDLSQSVIFGDSESDMEAGRRAGCATVRIGPGAHASLREAVTAWLA